MEPPIMYYNVMYLFSIVIIAGVCTLFAQTAAPAAVDTAQKNSVHARALLRSDSTHTGTDTDSGSGIQNTEAEPENERDPQPEKNKDSRKAAAASSQNMQSNPFISGAAVKDSSRNARQNYSHPHNPFALGGGTGGAAEQKAAKASSRVRIDLARGMTVALAEAEPAAITIDEGYGFTSYAGLQIRLAPFIYAGAGVDFSELTYTLQQSFNTATDTGNGISYHVDISTREQLRYVALPADISLRVPQWRSTPYLQLCVVPSVLASGNYRSVQRDSTVFVDEAMLQHTRSKNVDLTDRRSRFTVFAGGGIGYEYHYGYGSIYVQVRLLVSIIDPGSSASYPLRESTVLLYSPLSTGLRFSL